MKPVSVAERLAARYGIEPLDYAREEYWGCGITPGADACALDAQVARLVTDGTVRLTALPTLEQPPVDCFYIYPTVAPDPSVDEHGAFRSVEQPRLVMQLQAAWFGRVCRVFAPFYRQATIDRYLKHDEESKEIFRTAFVDVAAAFEHFLAAWNGNRPLVILGHSQGAQMASYLLHLYFDGATTVTRVAGSHTSDALRRRLLVAMPIGFHVFVPAGEPVGGSFSHLPLCEQDADRGCVISYRSYADGEPYHTAWATGWIDEQLAAEGLLYRTYEKQSDRLACVNPARLALDAANGALALDTEGNAAPAGARVLDGSMIPEAMSNVAGRFPEAKGFWLETPGRYTAACREDENGEQYLGIGFHQPATTAWPGGDLRGDPLAAGLPTSALGLHLIDFNHALGDLIDHVRVRIP